MISISVLEKKNKNISLEELRGDLAWFIMVHREAENNISQS
jgi:hypothetical protein